MSVTNGMIKEAVEAGAKTVEEVQFTETLEVNHLAFPEELDGLAHVRFLDQAQNVLIGGAGFLLCGQILCQVGDGVALHLEFTGVEHQRTQCKAGPGDHLSVRRP